MIRLTGYTNFALVFVIAAGAALAQAPSTPAKEVASTFAYVNKQILDMAKDFPADKYDLPAAPGDALVWRGHRAHRFRQCVRR